MIQITVITEAGEKNFEFKSKKVAKEVAKVIDSLGFEMESKSTREVDLLEDN